MDYEDLIEDDPQPAEETPEDALELGPVEPTAKSPWRAFILTGLLAGLIGAGGGAAAVYFALERQMSHRYMTAQPIRADLEQELRTETEKLNRRFEAVESQLVSLPALTAMSGPADLSGLETRLTALEKAPRPEIDPDALSALQAARKDGFEWPDTTALEDRIAGLEIQIETPPESAMDMTPLEERLAALEAQAETLSDSSVAAASVPGDLMDRIKTLEDDVQAFQTDQSITAVDETMISALETRVSKLENLPPPTPVVEKIAILAFPKTQLIAAVEANMDGGMIKKTLSRHIRVKDTNDPLTLIDGIESDLSDGRLSAAAEKFERLPAPVQAKGQAWYESVKASL